MGLFYRGSGGRGIEKYRTAPVSLFIAGAAEDVMTQSFKGEINRGWTS